MKAFILVITFVVTGQEPIEIEAKFNSQSDCESARIAALKEATIFAAHIRRAAETTGEVVSVPQVAAVCHRENSN